MSFIVSDIVPWIFETANQLNIKSLLVSNFTWTEIYKELFDNDIPEVYESFYKKADYVFEYPLSDNMNLNADKVTKVGLSCRKFNETSVERIKNKFKNPLVFVSLGRSVDINNEIELEDLPYDFIYAEGIKLKGKNTHKLHVNTSNMHDYIKASEIIITRTGWSTVSEAICTIKPMVVLNRPEIKEDENTVSNLLNLKIVKAIEVNQLNSKNLKFHIEETKKLKDNYKFLEERYQNNSEKIAIRILELL